MLDRLPAGAAAMAKLPPGGRFCRAVYDPLTTTGRSSARTQNETPAPDFALLIRATQEARTMRIYGPNGTNLGSPANNVRRTSSTGFALPDAASTPESRAAIAPKAAANIDALLAMQGIEEDPVERRRRSVQRGKGALDVLDDLKIRLLSGNFDAFTVSRLPGCRRQPQINFRRPRPRRGLVRNRAAGRGRTGQGRAVLKRFRAKWVPVRVKKTRQTKTLKPARLEALTLRPSSFRRNPGSAQIQGLGRYCLSQDAAI